MIILCPKISPKSVPWQKLPYSSVERHVNAVFTKGKNGVHPIWWMYFSAIPNKNMPDSKK